MKEILRSNDPVRMSWATALLGAAGIEAILLDGHTSTLEGRSVAILRRLMVIDEDFDRAAVLLRDAEAALPGINDAGADDAGDGPGELSGRSPNHLHDPRDDSRKPDRLLGERVLLVQPETGYRAAIDSVFLAAAVPDAESGYVLDAGSGAGAATLCYARRCAGAKVFGIDNQAGLVDLATDNAGRNGFDDRVAFLAGDIVAPPTALPVQFDHVMVNPPYLLQSRADTRTGADPATVEGVADLATWVGFCFARVVDGGTVTLVHRADRLDEILACVRTHAGNLVVYPLWPKREQEPKRILVQARAGNSSPLRLDPGMVLHEPDGTFTQAAEAILRDMKPIDLGA